MSGILVEIDAERGGGRRPYLRGAPPYRVVASLVLAMLALVLLPGRAAAATQLRVELTVDPTEVVVDLSPGQPHPPTVVTYEIVVENLGDDLVAGVEVIDELPAGLTHPDGRTVRMLVGDLGAHGLWRGEIETTLQPASVGGAQLANQVVVTSVEGDRVSSAPVLTSVTLISATSIVAPVEPQVAPSGAPAAASPDVTLPRQQPAPQVLGAVFTRGPDGEIVSSLPRTGVPLVPLTASGVGLVAIGAYMFHRGRD